MASLQLRSNSYSCIFCYQGKRRWVTLGEVSAREAEAFAGKVDHLLMRIRQRLLHVPEGTDIVDFILNDGQAVTPPAARVEPITLEVLKDRYVATHTGAMEESSLSTVRMHLGHFIATLGSGFRVQDLTTGRLQEHIDRRKTGKKLSPVTLK